MIIPIDVNVNRGGIPAIRSLSVAVTATQVSFDFNNYRTVGAPFRGLMVVNLAQAIPAGTTTTLPIVFTSDGSNAKALTTLNGVAVTAADITGTGVYLVWYESQTDTLQLLTAAL